MNKKERKRAHTKKHSIKHTAAHKANILIAFVKFCSYRKDVGKYMDFGVMFFYTFTFNCRELELLFILHSKKG